MRVLPRSSLVLVMWAGAAAAQTAPRPGYIDPGGRFTFTPPDGWRSLTPDEGRTLTARGGLGIPAELLQPEPPRVLVFGAVDRWLAGAYDGRALSILEQDGEPALDETELGNIRTHFAGLSARGPERFMVESLTLGTAGASNEHPALLSEVRISAGEDRSRTRFDLYIPTGGVTIILALTWPTADRDAGAAVFAGLRSGVQVAARPRGAAKLGSKLLWAGFLGLGLGVVLHALRKRSRA